MVVPEYFGFFSKKTGDYTYDQIKIVYKERAGDFCL